jgi:hypothetical protein
MVRILGVLIYVVITYSSVITAKPCNLNLKYAVKEVHNPSKQWTRIKDAPGDSKLTLRIGLKMDRWDELERHLDEGMS